MREFIVITCLLLDVFTFSPLFAQFGSGGSSSGGSSPSGGAFGSGSGFSNGGSSGGLSRGTSGGVFTSSGSSTANFRRGSSVNGEPIGVEVSDRGILSIGEGALRIVPISSKGLPKSTSMNLSLESTKSLGRNSAIKIYSAEGQTILVDIETRTFSNLGIPFGETVDIEALVSGIRGVAESDIGESLYNGNAESVARALIGLSSDRAGAIALALSKYTLVSKKRMIGPAFLVLATLGPEFLSNKKGIDQQINVLSRLLELSLIAYTPNPEDPEGSDPTLPPMDPLIDPTTGNTLPWLPRVKTSDEQEKQEKKREEEKENFEEIISDMKVNVIGPDWLVRMLPDNDPLIPSEINLSSNYETLSQSKEVLKSWCSMSDAPLIADIELEMQGVDILIVKNIEELIRSDPDIEACMSEQGLLQLTVVKQVLAFDGAVPLTRMRFDAPWTPGHIAASLANLQHQKFIKDSISVPGEKILLEPRKTDCECVKGDQISWTDKLLSGWVLKGSELWTPDNCRDSPSDDPRKRCAGTNVEIAPPVEANLISLAGGAPNSSANLSALEGGRYLDKNYLCAIDERLDCIPYNTYTYLKSDELIRFFRGICEAGIPGHPACTDVPDGLREEFEIYNPKSLDIAQRTDLLEADGTGLFLLPLGAVLFDSRIGARGDIITPLLDQVDSNSINAARLEALQMREKNYPLQLLPYTNMDFKPNLQMRESLLSGETPYVRKISIVVPRKLLSQLAIRSYVKHLTQEWSLNDETTSTFVTVSQLQNKENITTPSSAVDSSEAYDLAILTPFAPSNPVRDTDICEDLIERIAWSGTASEKLLAKATLMNMGIRCTRSIEGYFKETSAQKKHNWREALSKDMLLILAYVASNDWNLQARLVELGESGRPNFFTAASLALPRSASKIVEAPPDCPDYFDPFVYKAITMSWDHIADLVLNGSDEQFSAFYDKYNATNILQDGCIILPIVKKIARDRLPSFVMDTNRLTPNAMLLARILRQIGITRPALRPVVVEIIYQLLAEAGQEKDYLRDRQLMLATGAILGLQEDRGLAADALASNLINLRPADAYEENIWGTCNLLGALGPYSEHTGFLNAASAHVESLRMVFGVDDYLYERCLSFLIDGLVQSNYKGDVGLDMIEVALDAAKAAQERPPTGDIDRQNVVLAHLAQHGGSRAIDLLWRFWNAGERDAIKALAEAGANSQFFIPTIQERIVIHVELKNWYIVSKLIAASLAIGGWSSLENLSAQFDIFDEESWEGALETLKSADQTDTFTFANSLIAVQYENNIGKEWQGAVARLLGDLGAPAVNMILLLSQSGNRQVKHSAYLALAQILAEDSVRDKIILKLLNGDLEARKFCTTNKDFMTEGSLNKQEEMVPISHIQTICKPAETLGLDLN